MSAEVVGALNPMPGKTIVDCTLGYGGHALALLESGANVIGIDQDNEILKKVKERIPSNKNITFFHGNFADINNIIKTPVDGFLFDLGVSSFQIDEAGRGFSIRFDGPLDMRMDQGVGKPASFYINNLTEEELAKIFFEYGQERFSKRIARRICAERLKKTISTTFELKEIIEKAIPTWKKRESATRIFQALRIFINSELNNLSQALSDSISLLKSGGRICVISYHSLEDRIAKNFFRKLKLDGILDVLTKKPMTAGEGEIVKNPRAKSAKMRIAEKI
ncbi:MAG: 16S rRNA (cytosine1402-N4)-methyltransferase [Candidatus Saganbacteria bacterium]|uniref:Ribosomal RNA small subunit methyltransferase H n=1 Tax=Candidatus Saganbacteria bacterium TaxID=2575572 RepID=A0A833L066_UNCSA|nr:MAG: 16S rRNA (cytosine1402-N4)-methyltransferase [Candidatus Saganbacteria bacterium]